MAATEWTCNTCRAQLPDYLHVCRDCGAYRDDAAAPAAPAADAAPPTPRVEDETQRVARRNMSIGALWLGGGILFTLVSYSAVSSNGKYVAATGAIGYGLIRFLVGLSNYRR